MNFLLLFSTLWAEEKTIEREPIVTHLSIVSQLPNTQKRSLRPLLKQKRNEVLDRKKIRQDIQTLFLAGDFEEIEVEFLRVKDSIHVRYHIKEAPVLDKVVIEGAPRGLQKLLRNDPNLHVGQIFYFADMQKKLRMSFRKRAKEEGWGELDILDVNIKRKQSLVTLQVVLNPSPIQQYSRINWVGVPQKEILHVQWILFVKGIGRGNRISLQGITKAREAIRDHLVHRGWIQTRVNLPVAKVGENEYALTVRVEPGPKHSFVVDAPLPTGDKLMEVLDIYPGDRISEANELDLEQRVYQWLLKNGYVEAIPNVEIQQDNEVILITITIPYFKEQRLVSLEIVGAKRLNPIEIRNNIYEEVPSLKDKIYSQEAWEDAIEIVEELYLGQGFLDVQVQSGAIDGMEKKGKFELKGKIVVKEGVQLQLAAIAFENEDPLAMKNIRLPKMGVYRPNKIKNLHNDIIEAHREEGFLDVVVEEKRTIDRVNHQISFVFSIQKGPQYRLETLIVRGNRRTDSELITRSVSLKTGEIIRPSMMEKTRKDLYGMGPFQQVSLEAFGQAQENKSLILRLDERPNLYMTVAGGLTTDEGMQVRLVSGHRNLFRKAHKLNLVSQAGVGWNGEGWLLDFTSTDWRVSLRYDAPKITPKSSFFTELVLREQLQETNFRLYRSGMKMGISLDPSKKFRTLIEYGIQRVDLDDYDPGLLVMGDPWLEIINAGNAHRWSSGGTLSVIYDDRDSPFSPKEGGFISAGLHVRDGLLGMNPSVRTQSKLSYNIDTPIFRYLFGTDFGVGFMSSESTLPFDQRFYLGGASTLRGYARNQAGPMAYALRPSIDYPNAISPYVDMTALRDQPGQWIPVGGDNYWVITSEIHWPLKRYGFPHISLIIFTDIGRLSYFDPSLQENYTPTGNGIQLAFGSGIRWMTSVGPVALDLGINPNSKPERGESMIMPYFSFGNL